MLYFLAEGLANCADRAAEEFLAGLLDCGRDVVVVSKGRSTSFGRPDGPTGPRVRWVVDPGPSPRRREGRRYAPREWLSWLRATVVHRRRQIRAALVLRRFPPSVAIHHEFPYPGSFAHHVLHLAPRRLTSVRSTPECIAQFLRRRKTLTVESVSDGLSRMHGLLFNSPQLRDAWAAVAPITDIPKWVLSNRGREDEAARVLAVDRCQLRTSLGLPCQAFVAACVGYVHDGKGQDTLIAALPEMVRVRPDLLVVFVGNDRSEWAGQLKNTINESGLADHTRFVGRRPDPYSFIGAADLLIHPSRTEGQPRVVLEAMLLRTPVLASDVGGIPSLITHGDTGWLVPPDDPGALLRGFQHLIQTPGLHSELAGRAERAYWRCFSQQEYGTRLKAILQEIAGSSDLGPDRSSGRVD